MIVKLGGKRRLRPSRQGPTTGVLGGLGVSDRIAAFRSLGGNCEFGFVQRYCGAEPSGLFRFAYADVEPLTHAIADNLDKYGAPGDLSLEETESGTYYCRSGCYNFWYNTQTHADAVDRSAFLERQYGKVAHLKRALLSDLATGEKILVRKPQQGEDDAAFMALAQAIWRHGPSTVLRVTEGEPGLRRTSGRLLEGTVRRISQPERNYETDLESWIGLCDAAYAAHHGLRPAPAGPLARPTRLARPARRHDTGLPGEVLNSYTTLLDIRAFDPRTVYVFSAWVWIPADFSAARILAVMGTERLGWCDADLGLRDCWQRVWAAGRVAPVDGERPCAGLGIVGEPGQHVWSWGWELRRGPIPAPAGTPTVPVEGSFLKRLLGR
ncbi:hypothetical protein ASG40_00100 [Methylobacterium sp. Leaf399]|uniref:hypothetical protein n=1 Tax=Methylobacterium sp. Leaf399 TaxID=1736364 RepID=UPI0006FEAEEE|nr:hypothetical protein [Methylobacterium sp. Leaf399]KQT19305.1 hypothetical protein ASG40_00100 [Methylobacterium sp. Leaf399]